MVREQQPDSPQVLLAEEKEQYFTQLLTKKLFLVVSLTLPTSPMPSLLH